MKIKYNSKLVKSKGFKILAINTAFMITFFTLSSYFVSLQKYAMFVVLIYFVITIIIFKSIRRGVKWKAFTQDTKELVIKRQHGQCDECGVRTDVPEFHHVGSRGDNSAGNCQMLCPTCHARITRNEKRDKHKHPKSQK